MRHSKAESRALLVDGSPCRTIPLTLEYEAIVDIDDYERANEFRWHAVVKRRSDESILNVYARRFVCRDGGKRVEWLHRFILNLNDKVDHKNHDGLDCRKENLRNCTALQNSQNARIGHHNTSGYKGVTWSAVGKSWKASIRNSGQPTHLGYFSDKELAARAYDAAALRFHGNFACLNFPPN